MEGIYLVATVEICRTILPFLEKRGIEKQINIRCKLATEEVLQSLFAF